MLLHSKISKFIKKQNKCTKPSSTILKNLKIYSQKSKIKQPEMYKSTTKIEYHSMQNEGRKIFMQREKRKTPIGTKTESTVFVQMTRRYANF
jgi:hypothetical protein